MTPVDFEVQDDRDSRPMPVFDKNNSIESIIEAANFNGTYKDPYAGITFKEFHTVILNKDGEIEFEANVVFPDWFDENCVKIVASRYLSNAAKQQETDLRQMINRVSNTITNWGIKDGYFESESKALDFNYKLRYYQIYQYFAFNSPVYFNIGLNGRQQASACFINSIDDTMESIMDFAKTEALIFRQGSGSGANLSKIRSSVETVGGGTGFASGPCSFMKGHDTMAGVIKSGGRLRRAAKFCRLNVDHPDIHKFIICKNKEEEKLRLIKNAGIKPDPGYEISDEVSLQNTNISVGITDEFMNAVINDSDWYTKEVKTGKVYETMKARSLLMEIAQQSWNVADPGVQFDTTINKFNTTPAQGRINSSNPCVVGDTLLRSPEGDFKIKDLVESGRTEIPVYCCDPTTGEVHIRMGRNPRKTGEKKPVYKVIFSKGLGGIHSITTTANHKFIDSNGNTVLCEDLVFETKGKTRLMPFNKLTEKYRTSGGKETYIYNKSMKIKESHLVLNWKNGSPIKFGRNSDDFIAHHIDGNHLNNHPDNLEAITNTSHSSRHSFGENNPRYGVKVSDETKRRISESKKINGISSGRIFEDYCDNCGEPFHTSKSGIINGSFCSFDCKIEHQNSDRRRRYLAWVNSVKHKCPYCNKIVLSNALTCGSDKCIDEARLIGVSDDQLIFDHKRSEIELLKNSMLDLGASFICEGFDITTPNNWDMFLDADLNSFDGKRRLHSKQICRLWGNWTAFLSDVESRNHIVIGVEYVGEEDVYNITVDEFHTIAWGEIITHNCGEFLAPDDSSCNLASLNLVKFFDFSKISVNFNNDVYKDVIDTVIIAQDILVDNAEYPTEKIRKMTTLLRSLGLGYTGLGSLCMRLGFPYDSDDSRIMASLLTSLMSRYASETSANIADIVGPGRWFDFDENREAFQSVLEYQFDQSLKVTTSAHSDKLIIKDIQSIVNDAWKNAEYDLIHRSFRNSQLSLIAPTGTISFIMMSNSFGCEPHFALITYKRLSGSNGAILKTVVDDVSISLKNLGYSDFEMDGIIDKLVNHDIPIEQINTIKKEHVDIFTTAVPPMNGKNFISHMGHIKMMAAIQPFINGAISKTCNLPKETTPEDIYNLYIACWQLGLKSLTIYRDGSKENQVLSTTDKENKSADTNAPEHLPKLARKKLPTERDAKIHKFTINGMSGKIDGYLTRGLYENGELGEVFIEFAKDGSVMKGLVGAIVTLTSIAIQYGVPLEELVEKMIFRKFDPAGWVKGDPNIRVCNSIVDYIFQHLAYQHLDDDQLMKLGLKRITNKLDSDVNEKFVEDISNTQVCPKCGGIMRFLGRCMTCLTCAYSDGGSCS